MGLLAKLGRGVCLYEATAGRLTGAKRRRRNAIACFYKRINKSDMKIYHLRNGWGVFLFALLDPYGYFTKKPKKGTCAFFEVFFPYHIRRFGCVSFFLIDPPKISLISLRDFFTDTTFHHS